MAITSISSVAEFFQWHEEQKQLLQRYNRIEHEFAPFAFECFFRGMSNFNYELKPSVYRSQIRLQNEDKIIADCLAQRPQDFYNDKSTFERLVRMQHYGIPTRLLDISRSPLVALYFATQNLDENPGKLTAVFVTQQNIKYANDDTVSAVANVVHMPKWWSSFSSSEKYRNYLKTRNTSAKDDFVSEYNQRLYSQQLYQQILQEKPYFQPRLKKDDLEHIWCVIPPMNNDRIQRQQGAFLLFGVAGQKKHCLEIIDKDIAELLLDAIDFSEKLMEGWECCNAEETRDIVIQLVDKFHKYFTYNSIECNQFREDFKKLSRADDFGENVRSIRSKLFQQIIEKSCIEMSRLEAEMSENIKDIDLDKLKRYKFFYNLVYSHLAIFQSSVEVHNKANIQQELIDLGFTKSYLFPDLSSVGDEINIRYPVDNNKSKI